MKLCGIYLITHIATGRKYVGQSTHIRSRWACHARGTAATKIGAAILKHGWHSFATEILELCSFDQLNEAEMRWVAHFDCVAPKGFNLTTGGSQQKRYSEETKAKIAAANRLRVVSEETREKMRNRTFSEEARRKISLSKLGGTQTAESNAKRSVQSKRYAATLIPRLAELNRGRKNTPEHIAATAAAHRGSKRSPEACANISAGVRAARERRALLREVGTATA